MYNDPVAEVGVQVESDSVSEHVCLQPQGGGQGVAQAWPGGVIGYSVYCVYRVYGLQCVQCLQCL